MLQIVHKNNAGKSTLPAIIPINEFTQVCDVIEDPKLLKDWYNLDRNSVPESYQLTVNLVLISVGVTLGSTLLNIPR